MSIAVVPEKILIEDPYQTGEQRLETYLKKPPLPMLGKYGFISVPLDYSKATSGQMKIFYRLPKELDSNKPTIFYFYGGPGGTSLFSDMEKQATNFNIVYMDQRGTGFSRPEKFSELQNPENFSSEFIAEDAARVIRFLQLSKVSVYGHSYGTLVATIFASRFPDLTQALVLEGVLFSGEKDLWEAPHRVKILQKFFDSLPQEIREKILELSQSGSIPADWVSIIAQKEMYEPNFQILFEKKLRNLVSISSEARIEAIKENVDKSYMFEESIYFGAYMFHQIACQELNAGKAGSTWSAVFENGKLKPVSEAMTPLCLTIPGMQSRLDRTYHSVDYPLQVPVTYFQGTLDGATEAPAAINHYKLVPQKQAQLILMKGSGHSPLSTCLFNVDEGNRNCPSREKFQALIEKAFLGHELDTSEVKALEPIGHWVMTKKNWN